MGQKQPSSQSITQRVHTPTSDDRVASNFEASKDEELKKQKESGQRERGQAKMPANASRQSSRESARSQPRGR
jgi:hypothetical protein